MKHGVAEIMIFSLSLLLVPFLTLLVRTVLAPTLTVSWQGNEESGLLGAAAVAVAAAGCLVAAAAVAVTFRIALVEIMD